MENGGELVVCRADMDVNVQTVDQEVLMTAYLLLTCNTKNTDGELERKGDEIC